MPTFRQRFFDFMSNINPLVIVFLMCVGFSILTYIIPGGEFERRSVMVMGRMRDIVVPGSFHHTQSYPQGFFQLWTVFMRGAVEGAERSFVIMLSAGAMTAIIATGAISAGIHALIAKAGRLGIVFIPLIVFTIGLCGATFGMYEEGIPFILVLTPLMLAMGFDSMVAVFILYWGIAIGFACGITNPYNVAIGQAIANVPLYTGSWFRVVSFLVFMSITSIAIMRYAHRVHKDPTRSLSREEDVENRTRLRVEATSPEDYALTGRRILVLVLLAVGFGILMYGLMVHGWGFREIGSLFLWMGIIIPVAGGLQTKTMIEKNIEGMKSVVIAVVMMSAAQILYFILNDARILDTILNYFAAYLVKVPKVVIAYVMFGISALTAALLGSASGTAATVMPILAPLADVLHFSKQIVVLSFQFATGAFNFWMPWDGIAFTVCSMAGVKFFKYIRYTAKFAVLVYFPTALLMLLIAVVIDYK
ncbi:MAG TPA: Na+/H+ antiporter NhaC family protein [Terriglobales bacterium]|nr:Na+/H+ antiporter NhaC family protein [Terriglobales bacterium]